MKKTSIHTPALLVLVILIGLVGYFVGNQVPVLDTDSETLFPQYKAFDALVWESSLSGIVENIVITDEQKGIGSITIESVQGGLVVLPVLLSGGGNSGVFRLTTNTEDTSSNNPANTLSTTPILLTDIQKGDSATVLITNTNMEQKESVIVNAIYIN